VSQHRSISNDKYLNRVDNQREIDIGELEKVLDHIHYSIPITDDMMKHDADEKIITRREDLDKKIKLFDEGNRFDMPIGKHSTSVMGQKKISIDSAVQN